MQRIRKGDEVIVIAGKDKGKRGVVLSRMGASHLMIEGINIVKKHTRPNPMKNVTGGITDKTMPIEQSNVMLFDPATDKGGRVGINEVEGKRVRVFRSNGNLVGQAGPGKPARGAKQTAKPTRQKAAG